MSQEVSFLVSKLDAVFDLHSGQCDSYYEQQTN